ncbi:P-loop containing nucleoside triphosphate hydrolase protein [Globomyces pollinis-pini]|nr:P-loop containing nucleoside triphosphate hydrolase protein [Globomyces pollinis-pini]
MIAIIDRNKRRKVKEPLIEPGITITFNDIGYKIRNQTILRNVTGAVNPGELLAIMGPSGSGKSTCLDILACKNKGGIITGDIRINGKHVNKNVLFSDISGYVDQDDIHLPTMTVKEILDFSAGLRLPESMTYRQKDDRVADVLELLGLTHVADKRIGDHLQRGISGGEKRRLSIGVELVTNPSILFLDEPTSGLDSFNAFQVMDTLSKLAKNSNRTIIFTIHQPNSTIYSCFDKLLLLSNGSPYYFGHASDAEEYFQTIGLPCPPQYHIADHLLNCTATSANQKQTYQSSYGTPLTDIKCDDLVAQSSISIESFQDMKIIPSSCTTLTQLQRVLGRSMKSFLRNPTLFITHITMSIVLGTLIGLLYYQVDSTLAGIQNRLGSIFFLQSLLAFAGLSAISSLQNDLILFLRERSNGFYGVFPYYLSKILFDLIPLRIIPTLIISTIPYFLIGLSTNPFNYIKFVSTMVLFSMNSGLFCLLIGCLVNDMGTAILISSVIILFKMLFAGILINQFQIPIYLRWIQYLSFFKYAYEACVVNDSTGILITDTISGMDVTFPATLVLSKFGFQIDAFWFDFGVSGGICLCLLLTIAIVMNFKLKLKK